MREKIEDLEKNGYQLRLAGFKEGTEQVGILKAYDIVGYRIKAFISFSLFVLPGKCH